jgi:hypothetical protein
MSCPRTGAAQRRPKAIGALTRKVPAGSSLQPTRRTSAASNASKARATSVNNRAPSSVGLSDRVVRWISRAPTLFSSVFRRLLTTAKVTPRRRCFEAEACQDHASEERSRHVPATEAQIVICGRGGPDDLRECQSALDQLQNSILDAA